MEELQAYALALEIVEKTRDSYEAAWTHLVWLLSILGFVVGIAFPTMLEILRRVSTKADIEKAKAEVRQEAFGATMKALEEGMKQFGEVNREIQKFVFEQNDRISYRLYLLENEPQLAASVALNMLKRREPPKDSREAEGALRELGEALRRSAPGGYLSWLHAGDFIAEVRKTLGSPPYAGPVANLILQELDRITKPSYVTKQEPSGGG